MANKDYILTQSGTYTVVASDSSGQYQDSLMSNSVVYKALIKLLKINNKTLSKLSNHYVATVNGREVICGLSPKLATPANLTVTGTRVSFEAVEGATSYEVFANGNSIGEVEVNK